MFGCDLKARERAYKAIVRPLLEYACVVWSPHTVKDVNLLEAVQRDVLHGGLVVVVGTQLHLLGPFLMIHVTRCCTCLHCVLGVIIYQFVPSRTFVTMA